MSFVITLSVIIALEVIMMFIIRNLRKRFRWLITPLDEYPKLDEKGLKKFIEHGYDPQLGWVRKANTSNMEKGRYGQTCYHIGSNGARLNPGHEELESRISCFGDSFTFCRQVNDDETWAWYLSRLSGTNVLNFGVGNYGIDQAYLRMLRELKNLKTNIVMMGVVPSTIVRILCVWKHYNEFGNTFGFKPRFELKDGKLILIKNIIDDESKFYGYEKFLEEIRANDYFYKMKFRNEMIRFPYLYSVLRKPGRNIPIISALLLSMFLDRLNIKNSWINEYPLMKIMEINRILRYRLFQDGYVTNLMRAIVQEFISSVKEKGAKPILLLMPQKDDVLFIRRGGFIMPILLMLLVKAS